MTIRSGGAYWEQAGTGWMPGEVPREAVTERPTEQRRAEVEALLSIASDKDREDCEGLSLREALNSSRPTPNWDALVAELGTDYLAVKAYSDFALASCESAGQAFQHGE
jgi:hypothetical protein